MKILRVSVLAGVMAAPAVACDLCSVYSAMQARGEVEKGFTLGVAEQFTHYGTLQTDGAKVPNDLDQHLDSSISQLFLGYNFNDRLGAQVNLPIIHRSFQRADDAGASERGSESGIGDVSLVANFLAYRTATKKSTFAWTVHAGLKFPTGSSDRLREELDELTAPGGGGGAVTTSRSAAVRWMGSWARACLRAGGACFSPQTRNTPSARKAISIISTPTI